MKPVVKYSAEDRTLFDTQAKAEAHDQLCSSVDAAMRPLGEPPERDAEFRNVGGYVQHDQATRDICKGNLVKIAQEIHEWFRKYPAHEIHLQSFGGRLLCEAGPAPLWRAWCRLTNIDDQGREWGQAYFAMHPEMAKNVVLEDRSKNGSFEW